MSANEGKHKSEIKNGRALGEVKDSESLARLVILLSTLMVGKDRRIRKGALKIDNLRNSNGWSFIRQEYASMSFVLKRHAEDKPGKKPSDYGYASVQAGAIRSIKDGQDKNVFHVLDDPLEKFPEHALVQQTSDYKEEDLRGFRKHLLKLFSTVKTQ